MKILDTLFVLTWLTMSVMLCYTPPAHNPWVAGFLSVNFFAIAFALCLAPVNNNAVERGLGCVMYLIFLNILMSGQVTTAPSAAFVAPLLVISAIVFMVGLYDRRDV